MRGGNEGKGEERKERLREKIWKCERSRNRGEERIKWRKEEEEIKDNKEEERGRERKQCEGKI